MKIQEVLNLTANETALHVRCEFCHKTMTKYIRIVVARETTSNPEYGVSAEVQRLKVDMLACDLCYSEFMYYATVVQRQVAAR